MWQSREPRFDIACAISQGARDYQEDAIASDFMVGSEAGFVILSDGMGGHAAGDIASKILLTEAYSELKFHCSDLGAFEENAAATLRGIANSANNNITEYVADNPDSGGMGATLIISVILENRLYWVSVGDSPLYLLRQGQLEQLNEDHSMAPQIDLMVKTGLLDAETAVDHPDRNCLTSVMMGTKIKEMDCSEAPFELAKDDILICASDGIQFLTDDEIKRTVHKLRRKPAASIAAALLRDLAKLDDPDQDNISYCVIKVNDASSSKLVMQTPAKIPNDVPAEKTEKDVSAEKKDVPAEKTEKTEEMGTLELSEALKVKSSG